MQKRLVAIATSAAILSAPGFAFEVYNDGTNRINIGGRAEVIGQAGDNADGTHRRSEMSSGSTRINFGFEHQIHDRLHAEAMFEWQVNMLNSNDDRSDPLTNRLGYIGLVDQKYGTYRMGKQWAAVYDVFGATDVIYISDHDAGGIYQFGDGGTSGTGRLDDSATFANTIGAWTVGLQAGTSHTTTIGGQEAERGTNLGASVSYEFANSLKLGVAHTTTEIKQGFNGMQNGDNIRATAASATYQNYGYHIAGTLVSGENYHTTGFQTSGSAAAGNQGNATGADIYFAYQYELGIEPYVYGSVVSFDGEGANTIKGDRTMVAAGVIYNFDPQVQIGLEYRNINTILDESDENIGFKARYFF